VAVSGDPRPVPAEAEVESVRPLIRRSLLPFVLINAVFFYFFYDSLNLNFNIVVASHLALRLSPFSKSLAVLYGYPLLPLDQLSFYSYSLFGFNPWVPVLLLKALAAAATYGGGLLCYRIAVRHRLVGARKLFYAFAFNPFFLFINDIWVETDVLIIVLVLAGYYLLREPSRRPAAGETPRLLLGTAAIVVAVLGYYSPAVLVPALVIYAGPRARQIRAAIWFVVLGAILAAPVVLFHLNSGAPLGLVTRGGANVYSVLNLFTPSAANVSAAAQQIALVGALGISVGVPALFHRWRIAEPVALWVVFASAISLAFSYVQPDNFFLFVGFLFLCLLYIPGTAVTNLRIIALQLFLVPVFYFIEMWNGPGLAAGIFYWSFPTFHLSVNLFDALGGVPAWMAALALYLGGLLGTTAYLVREAMRARGLVTAPSPALPSPSPLRDRNRPPVPWTVFAAFVLVTGTPLVVAGLDVSTNTIDYGGVFPSQLYVPVELAPGGGYLMPSPTTYLVDPVGGRLTFTPSCPPTGLVTLLSSVRYETRFNVELQASGPLTVGSRVPYLNSSGLVAGFASELELPSGTAPLSPYWMANASRTVVNSTVLSNATPAVVSSPATSVAYAASAASLSGENVVFGEFVNRSSTGQIRLWSLIDGTDRWEADIDGGNFAFGRSLAGGPWSSLLVPQPDVVGEWVLAGVSFDATNQSVTAVLDSSRLTLTGGWTGTGSANLSMGRPPWSGAPLLRNAEFDGIVTVPYLVSPNALRLVTATYIETPGGPAVVPTGQGTDATGHYLRSVTGTSFEVNGASDVLAAPDHYVAFGKFSPAAVTVAFRFEETLFATATPQPDLIWVVADFTLLLPGSIVAWFLVSWRRARGRASPSP
jgi:hypothetical protein